MSQDRRALDDFSRNLRDESKDVPTREQFRKQINTQTGEILKYMFYRILLWMKLIAVTQLLIVVLICILFFR
jgi:hypothetical protein